MDAKLKAPLVEITPQDGVELALAYATAENFTGKPVYATARCYLHPDAALCLGSAARLAGRLGYRLKLFDAFRPAEAQQILWDFCPDPEFLADPKKERTLAAEIAAAAGVEAHEVLLDVPSPPRFRETKLAVRRRDGETVPITQASRLVRILDEARLDHWRFWVFAPRQHVERVAAAARRVLE